MTTKTPSAALVPVAPVFTNTERLASMTQIGLFWARGVWFPTCPGPGTGAAAGAVGTFCSAGRAGGAMLELAGGICRCAAQGLRRRGLP
jgi:hypothetical protein